MKKFVEKVKSIFTKVKNFVKKHWKKAAAAVGVAVISFGVGNFVGFTEAADITFMGGTAYGMDIAHYAMTGSFEYDFPSDEDLKAYDSAWLDWQCKCLGVECE